MPHQRGESPDARTSTGIRVLYVQIRLLPYGSFVSEESHGLTLLE